MRKRYEFWLDDTNKDHQLVGKTIKRMKKRNQFASAVRDGIMLIAELRAGKIDLLLKLFPWVEAKIVSRAGGGDKLIEEFRQLLAQQQFNAPMPEPPPDYPVLKPMAAPKKLTPVMIDDDDDVLSVKKSTSFDPGANFMASIFGEIKPRSAEQ